MESSEILALLRTYDPADLAAGVGALQLIPDNADRLLRLQAVADLVAGVAATATPGDDKPRMRPKRWRELLNGPAITTTLLPRLEDPHDELFVDQVTFLGGSFRVQPGIAERATFIVRHLLKGVLLSPRPFPDAAFADEARRLGVLALALSDTILRRAGLERGTPAAHPADRRVLVPATDRFEVLKAAVTFSQGEITSLLSRARADEGHLAAFVGPAGGTVLRVELEDLDRNPVLARPIVRVGDRHVVVAPAALLGALRHAIVSAAVTRRLTAELALAFRSAIMDTVDEALGRLDLHAVALPEPTIGDAPITARWYRLDVDKLLYAVIVTDPLTAYDVSEPYGEWPVGRLGEQLQSHLAEAARRAKEWPTRPSEILFLVLTQGVGRPLQLEAAGELAPPGTRVLVMNAADVEVITLLEHGNPLALRQYADAQARFLARTRVVKTGELDEFAFYRTQGYGYYASDTERPDWVSFQPGVAEVLHHEVFQKHDFHGVEYAGTGSFGEVVLLHGDPSLPLYVLRRPADRAAILVERLPLPIWVLGPETVHDQRYLKRYLEFADLIAYWIWQCAADLRQPLAALAARVDHVLVRLALRPSERWLGQGAAAAKDPMEQMPIDLARCTVSGRDAVEVEFDARIIDALNRPDNAGERELMKRVVGALGELLDRDGIPVEGGADAWAAAVVERHAPLGQKKRLIVLDGAITVRLDRGSLPSRRGVQKAEEGRILDDIGAFLGAELHLPVGPIPANERVKVLNKIVEQLFSELTQLMASLAPDGLLPWLVASNERLVIGYRRLLLTVPTHVALFGATQAVTTKIREELTDAAKALIPSRFLIEYAVACPPSGSLPMSLATYDRLLALASAIFTFGTASDLLKYRLADIRLAYLPSGRLGQSTGVFGSGREQFLHAFAVGTIGRAQEHFARHWSRPEEAGRREVEEMVDGAALAEFGFTVTDILNLLMEGVNAGDRRPGAVKTAERNALSVELATALEWDEAKVRRVLDLLLLRPRASFLKPPAPFSAADVYPWRFNRALSYLRRPFLLQERDGVEEIVWGVANLFETFDYLVGLFISGRYKESTGEIKRVMSELQSRDSRAFNNRVAEICAQRLGFRVRPRAEKFGRLRIQRADGSNLGDIDVLAADVGSRTLWSIEVKDLDVARTPAELASELESTFGTGGPRRSHVETHMERTTWLQEHLPAVLESLGVTKADARQWQIRPLVVVSHELLGPFIAPPPMRVVTIRELQAFLASAAMRPARTSKPGGHQP